MPTPSKLLVLKIMPENYNIGICLAFLLFQSTCSFKAKSLQDMTIPCKDVGF